MRSMPRLVIRLALAVVASAIPAGVIAQAAPEPAPAARTLYLVRHGAYDTSDPRDERVGRALVPIGVAQARLAGARLAGLPVAFRRDPRQPAHPRARDRRGDRQRSPRSQKSSSSPISPNARRRPGVST